jgi:cytidylate kinase
LSVKAHRRRSETKGLVLAGKIFNILDIESGMSLQAIATQPGIGKSTVMSIIQEDLHCKSYTIQRG